MAQTKEEKELVELEDDEESETYSVVEKSFYTK